MNHHGIAIKYSGNIKTMDITTHKAIMPKDLYNHLCDKKTLISFSHYLSANEQVCSVNLRQFRLKKKMGPFLGVR